MVAARSNAGRGETGGADARVGRDSFVEGRMRSGLLLRFETATAGRPDIAGFRHTARLSNLDYASGMRFLATTVAQSERLT
jgi:hypothetical protein